jgi:CHASE3 domain sensor protein
MDALMIGDAIVTIDAMHHRAARLILLVVFLAALSTSAYLFWKSESLAAAQTAQARSFDASARAVEREWLELRSAQRSYVAAGQGGDFWASRVAESMTALRKTTAALRAAAIAPQAQTSIDEVIATLNDFGKIDKRAVEYVRRNQPLLASDVIFADGRELTDEALTALEQARTTELALRAGAADESRRRALFAITAGTAAAVLAVLLLLPRAGPKTLTVPAAERTTSIRPVEARRVEAPSAVAESLESPGSVSRANAQSEAVQDLDLQPVPDFETAQGSGAQAGAHISREQPVAAEPEPLPATDFGGVAALCVDLARVVDTRALPSLLDRAASLLDASGIILWIADPDGRELNPIFAQGYPQQLVNRLGTIPRDAENATAAAFRTSLLQTVRADEISPGAIAAPLVTPGGCVGVMAAEVLRDSERQHMKLAAATIVAAQLATLVGPPARNHAKSGAAGA